MQAADAKPAYVVFETRSIEDRDASLSAGHYVGKDVIFAIITPQGSKDKIERVADEWLKYLDEQVRNDRFPPEWAAAYRNRYKAYLEGREIPLDGTPILTWPAISPSQQRAILEANVRTIQDLATANEATISAIGMGARALVAKAKVWLESAEDVGKVASKLEILASENTMLTTQNQRLEEQLAQLQVKVDLLSKEDA